MGDSDARQTGTGDAANRREIEPTIERDFSSQMSYGDYLRLDLLLAAQQPQSDPPQHDELLFIVQHQTSELWLKLMVHELRSARDLLGSDDLAPALKRLARVKHIQRVLTDQWAVLATLTPSEYAEIRPVPGHVVGLPVGAVPRGRVPPRQQGRRHGARLRPRPRGVRRPVRAARRAARCTTSSCATSPATGTPSRPTSSTATSPARTPSPPGSSTSSRPVYAAPAEHWGVYETCEELVDVEDNFQQWRFRHLQVVQRTIGHKVGTGGSSGVDFLRRALDLTFFPELFAVRTRVGE